jgi:hypothetical protein
MTGTQPADRPDRPAPFGEADALFEQVLAHLEESEWGDAVAALRALLALMPDYPQARGLLALAEDAERALYSDSPQIDALRAYVRELRADRRTAAAPPTPPAAPDPYDPRAWHNLPEAAPAIPTPRSAVGGMGALADSESREADYPPLAMAAILRGVLDDPHRILAYYQQTGHPAVARASAWLVSGLLWLPVLLMSLALLVGNRLGLPPGAALLFVGLVLAAWPLTAWLGWNNSVEVGLMLAGCAAPIVWFLAAGSLSLVGMAAGGVIALLCISAGVGMAVALLEIGIQQAIFKLASGAGAVIATVTAGLILTSITPVTRGMLAAAWAGSGLTLSTAILAGLAGMTTYLASFGIAAGALFLLLYPGAFLTAFIFEGGQDMGVGPVARHGLLVVTVALYAALAAVMLSDGL